MTKDETIREVCRIVALAYRSIDNYEHPSDGFCTECNIDDNHYRNSGKAIEFVREAVIEKLKREGYTVKV